MCCAFVVDGRLGFSGLEGVDNDPLGAPRPKREGRWVLKVTALVGLPVAVPDAAAYIFDGDVSFAWSQEKAGTVPETLAPGAMSLTLVDPSNAAGTTGAFVGRVAKLLVFGNSFSVWPKAALSNKPPPDMLFVVFLRLLSVFLLSCRAAAVSYFLLRKRVEVLGRNSVSPKNSSKSSPSTFVPATKYWRSKSL